MAVEQNPVSPLAALGTMSFLVENQPESEFFRAILESAHEGVWALNAEYGTTYVNRRMAEMLGWSPDEMLGRSLYDFLSPALRPVAEKIFAARRSSVRETHELMLRHRDGSNLTVLISTHSVWSENEFAGAVALVADVTQRQVLEEELRRQKEYFRALTDQSLDILSVLDMNGTILFESSSLERWAGWKPQEIVGRNAFEFIHPEDRGRVVEVFQSGMLKPGKIDLIEYRFLHKDGSWRTFESWGHNLLNQPHVRGVIVSTRDVTDRTERERREALLNKLIVRLNSTDSIPAAGTELAAVTDELFGWDGFVFSMYGAKEDNTIYGLNIDTVDGSRVEVPWVFDNPPAGSLTRRVIEEGPKLIHAAPNADSPFVPFGNMQRSQCIIAVPITVAHGTLGLLALHSYTPRAFTRDDLHRLQTIAERCGASLQRMRTAEKLAENEARYRSLVHRLPVAVLVHQEGKVVFANPAALKLLRANTSAQLVGRDIPDLIPPAFQSLVAQRIQRALAGEPSSWMEQQLRRLDGTLAEVEATSLRSIHQGQPAVQTILHEITDRKRAEQRQAVQYAATRVLAQLNGNTEEQFLRVVCEGLGWSCGELWLLDPITRTLHLGTTLHPSEPAFRAFDEAGRKNGVAIGNGIPGRVWRERQILWCVDVLAEPSFGRKEIGRLLELRSGAAFPIFIRDEFAGVVQLFSRETREPDTETFELFKVLGTLLGQYLERKQIQQQLLQAQKMEAVGQLAGGVAHDFNNLLTIIAGHAQIAAMDPALSADVSEAVREISGAAERAANLTRQLLTFSRKQVIQTRPLQLNSVLNELAKMLRRIIGEQISLRLELADDLPAIDADVGMLEQVILNLAVNARDAMPEGGDLIISTNAFDVDATAAVRLPQARRGRYVRVEVRDTGCGMSSEIAARVFEPFFTTKPAGRGTGLGLATAYGIVRQHNGWIEVDSTEDVGTTFRIYFPALLQPAAGAAESEKNSRLAAGNAETILIVEDERALRSLARRLLERAGYNVLEAASGHEAIAHFEKHHADIRLVITDMVMPGGMNGRELARRLREHSPGLRIVFTTGYTTELGDNILERENIGFIGKPYTAQQLTRAIREALDRKT